MTRNTPLVCVVDDDESIRESLPDLLAEFGFDSRVFTSAEEFLAGICSGNASCLVLVLDIALGGMSGLDLQRELARRQQNTPVVFITANRSDAMRARLLSSGAVECLIKPFSEQALIDAINEVLKSG